MDKDELPQAEADYRAKEVARRLLTTPPKPQTKPAKATDGDAKPRKRGRPA
jgi:hypothetical protein